MSHLQSVVQFCLNNASRPDRAASIAGSGRQIHFPKRRPEIDLAVCNRVRSAAAGEREIRHREASMEREQERKEGFFINNLSGPRQILMSLLKRLTRISWRPK